MTYSFQDEQWKLTKKTLVRVQSGSGLLMFVKKTFVQFSNSKRQTDSFVYYWWNTKLSYTDIEERERQRAERVKILKFSVSFIYSFNFQCLAVVFFVHTLKIGCHKKKIYAKTTGELCKLFQPNKLIIFFVNYDHFLARYYYVENLAQCFQWVLQDIALSAL